MAITSFDITCEKKPPRKHDPKSPYLNSDKVQLLSRVTEKRFLHKKTLDYVSSFPLALNIYKTNSDEFKSLKRTIKKNKKSVLTLPNASTPAPQVCTVSDMNDSEYYSQSNDNNKTRLKKRSAIKNVRKSRLKNKELDLYDRNARYCSNFDINVDSSSTALIKNHKGDGRRVSNLTLPKGGRQKFSNNDKNEEGGLVKPHNVWAVLRNLNRFPFRPSPPASEESLVTPSKKFKKRRANCKDTRVFETCHTEEIAYISSYKVDGSNSRSLSQSSSFDRVTVIDKQDDFGKMCKEIEERFLNTNISKNNKNGIGGKNKTKKKSTKKGNLKALCHSGPTENNAELTTPKHNVGLNTSDSFGHEIENITYTKIGTCGSNLHVTANKNIEKHKDVEPDIDIKDYASYIYSDNSGSSKAELTSAENKLKGRNYIGSPYRRVSQVNGISRVNIGKTCEPTSSPVSIKRNEVQKRKPRLVTTMPSACMMPKLTQTEIKRRLAAMRFPVVILGRDQVNSPFELQDYDPPQFNGLDKQIWPFMLKWRENKDLKHENIVAKQNIKAQTNNGQLFGKGVILNSGRNIRQIDNRYKNEVTPVKRTNYRRKNNIDSDNSMNKDKSDVTSNKPSCYQDVHKLQQSNNQKSITQLKDKMLNLLYKKISSSSIWFDNYNKSPINRDLGNTELTRSTTKKFDAYTDPQLKVTMPLEGARRLPVPKGRQSPVRLPTHKTQCNSPSVPWAKAKRVNDFIENVIKKIKNGVYYNHEQRSVNSKDEKRINLGTDMTIPAKQSSIQEDVCSDQSDFPPKVTIIKKSNMVKTIPGFESALPGLEVKTLNVNQIAVKHCITNVMMQFDVTVPVDTNIATNSKASLALIPIEVTESHTKIFKYKTNIVNAMLPAEVCSIVPKILKLLDQDIKSLRPAFCCGLITKAQPHLSTINELSRNSVIKSSSIEPLYSMVSPFEYLSPCVKQFLGGMFSKTPNVNIKNQNEITISPKTYYDYEIIETLPKPAFKHIDILTYSVSSFLPALLPEEINNTEQLRKNSEQMFVEKPLYMCRALEVYSLKKKQLISPFKPYNFATTIVDIINKTQVLSIRSSITFNFNLLKLEYNDKKINVYMTVPYKGMEKTITMSISNNNLATNEKIKDIVSPKDLAKCIEYIKHCSDRPLENKQRYSVTDLKVATKVKRKGYYKLYRKCKSATNIPAVEKCINTSLNKIQNLDDFLQIFSSKRLLSSVFDGYAARKILSSVAEMKNWATDINPKQALLLLLLTNKKDTPNLVRFRPILLQGIAVNRITRATELDMEIEVIERENFNKLTQYEGISYLPASVENQDQLLEELYWIAKTTASDYHKQFDESSERHLKSLLEKRKKLNPSYLRVMARYVGLGLLKSPGNK